jgi:cobalamin biosynthesis protein CbiG
MRREVAGDDSVEEAAELLGDLAGARADVVRELELRLGGRAVGRAGLGFRGMVAVDQVVEGLGILGSAGKI